MERQKTQNGQHNIEGKVKRLTLPDVKIYHKAIVIKTAWYWRKKMDKYINRRKSPELYPHKYRQLIFDQGVKAFQGRKDSLFYKWC